MIVIIITDDVIYKNLKSGVKILEKNKVKTSIPRFVLILLFLFVTLTLSMNTAASTNNTPVMSNTTNVSHDSVGLNSASKSAETSTTQGTTTKSATINITNDYRDAHSPGYPNPGNVINNGSYDNWAWTVITLKNNGPDNASVTIQDIGSTGFVYYNPSIGWSGYVRFNNGSGWIWDKNFNVTTGLGTYNLTSGVSYQIAILGYINQTGTISNTVKEISQDVSNPYPYPTVTTTLNVPPAAIIKTNEEFRTSLNGSPTKTSSYLDWVYNVIKTTNTGPNATNVKYQITLSGLTPNGTYKVSKDNGVTWTTDGSYNTGTSIWSINVPSNTTYLIAIYMQITGKDVTSTVKEITQDVYNPYSPDNTIPKCLVVFDDGNVAQYTIAFKYMQSKGIVGTAYDGGFNIGIPQVMTLDEMHEMEAAGWIIGSHSYDHVDLTQLTDDQILSELSLQINFLINNGFSGAYDLAYPGGYSNEDVWTIMKQLGIHTGRTTVGQTIYNLNDLDMYQIPAYTLLNTTPVSDVKGYIDNALQTDSTIVILFHNIVNSNPSEYDYLTSNFKSIIDYIAASGISCLNINSLYQQSNSPINIPSDGIVYSNQSTSNGYTSSEASLTVTNTTADVAVTNSVSNSTPNYLDNVNLTVTVQNNGPGTAENVSVTESLNGNYLTWVSDDSNGTYNHNTGIWTIGNLNSGQTVTLHITAKVNTNNITITNKATYNPTTTDPNSTNNNQTVTMTVSATNADVAVTNSVSNNTPNYLDNVNLTVTVQNNGPGTAQSVKITESLNGNYLTWVSDDSNGTYDHTTGIWTIGTLTSGQIAILHITAKVNTANITIINTATYNPIITDPNSTNNNQTVTMTVPATNADIAVTNTVSNTTPKYNDTITFTITVKNNGPSTAQNVSISEWTSNGLTYVSDDSNGALNLTNGIWTIGTLTSGQTAILHITAKVNTANTTITNKATYNPVTTDPNSSNNNQTVTLTVPATNADIAVTNTVSNATPKYNDTITFTITVKNNGPDAAQNVTIKDASNNSYLTYVSDDSNGALNLTNGVWTIGTLTSGQTVTLHITAKANTATKTITNTATYTPVTIDPNSTNNSQTVTITVT
jgi:uncharacterized repeat protein (TIGR01451 family)